MVSNGGRPILNDLASVPMDGAEHLAGPAEIGEELGVDANTVNQWKSRHPDFPEPVRVLKAGSVWDLRDVVAWAKRTGRLEGDDEDGDPAVSTQARTQTT